MGGGETRINRDGAIEEPLGLTVVVLVELRQVPQTTVTQVPRIQVLGGLAPRALALDLRQFGFDRAGDGQGDLVLQVEDVCQLAVVALRPNVVAVAGIDELRGDPHTVAAFAHTAFQDIANAKLSPDLADIG